jgi:nucleoid-associated protein YgaU
LWAEDDAEADAAHRAEYEEPAADPSVPRRGRGLSGSYADRVAGDAPVAPGGMDDDEDERDDSGSSAPMAASAAALAAAAAAATPAAALPPELPAGVEHAAYAPEGWDNEEPSAEPPPPRVRRREREEMHADRSGRQEPPPRPDNRRTVPAPEWERARPLEAYPTIRSRRLSELSIPPILVAIVALALAAAVLFALPGLLGFGSPQAGASASPSTPVITPIPSVNPTPVPQPTPQLYTVQSGDTLSRIAGRFGIPLNDLIAANTQTLPDPNKLQVGQQIIIPPKGGGSTPTGIPSAT